jgi:hypothetical protein
MKMHLIKGAEIAGNELGRLGYNEKIVEGVQEAIRLHKYNEPYNINDRILIDADNLSDIYKEQFKSDIISYNTTSEKLIKYRSQNVFYSDKAKKIFELELLKRKGEQER